MAILLRTVDAANERALSLNHDITHIPNGDYCYTRSGDWKTKEDGKPYFPINLCPYWAVDGNRPEQEAGYCSFIKKSDWEDEGTLVLWDQVKCCGINVDIIDFKGEV